MRAHDKYRGRVTVTRARLANNATERDILKDMSYGFITVSSNKVFYMNANSSYERDLWILMITKATKKKSRKGWSPQENRSSTCVRSITDLKIRNEQVLDSFYRVWKDLMERDFTLFPIESGQVLMNLLNRVGHDASFTLKEHRSTWCGKLHGREGFLQYVLAQRKRLTAVDYMTTKRTACQAHAFEVKGTVSWKMDDGTLYEASWKHHVVLSPGGKIDSLRIRYSPIETAGPSTTSLSQLLRQPFATQSSEDESNFASTLYKRFLSLSLQDFNVLEELGRGAFGIVVLAENRETGQQFAIKMLDKSTMSDYDCRRTQLEMRIMRDVHHPFIASLR